MMHFYFEHNGRTVSDTDLRKVVEAAETLLRDMPGRSLTLMVKEEDRGQAFVDELIRLPVEDPSDEPYLTGDWMRCYLNGCYFLRRKNGNQPFCGKKHNPNHPFERLATPVGCPVKFPKQQAKTKSSEL